MALPLLSNQCQWAGMYVYRGCILGLRILTWCAFRVQCAQLREALTISLSRACWCLFGPPRHTALP